MQKIPLQLLGKGDEMNVINITIMIIAIFLIVSTLSLLQLYSNCYEKDYIFINQYLGDYDSKDETSLLSCKNCLWIEATDIKTGTDHRFFFAKEHELREFKKSEKITMKWCESEKGHRIMGVWNE